MKHIQWFPGHMTKAMRMMRESAALVDGAVVVLDARAPAATFNRKITEIFGAKPVLYVLNKADLADGARTDAFLSAIEKNGFFCVKCSATSSAASKALSAKIRDLLREKREKDAAKGIVRPLRLMVSGIPNAGKSTVINALCGSRRAVTGDKAGVTRGKQWIRLPDFELLDTPGTMPPAFDNQTLARHLAYIGSINDDILDFSELAVEFLKETAQDYPQYLTQRYGIEDFSSPEKMLECVCRRRGFLLRGGETDGERGARALLDDFRKGRLGKITLEAPEEYGAFIK